MATGKRLNGCALVLAGAYLIGCGFDTGVPLGDGPQASGPEDEPTEEAPENPVSEERCQGWQPSSGLFDPCSLSEPAPVLVLDSGTFVYDTDSSTLFGPGGETAFDSSVLVIDGVEVHALSLEGLAVQSQATLSIVGDRPLLVAAWAEIDIAGTVAIDGLVEDQFGSLRFAAGSQVGCGDASPMDGSSNDKGAAGGAGGSLGESGAAGGTGADDGTPSIPGNPGGQPQFSGWGQSIVGGCAGGQGGLGVASQAVDAVDRGFGGAGGGSIHLAALNQLGVSGRISAAGAGGGVGYDFGGGGGGGSGGYVGLEAATIAFLPAATVKVGGGGGGGGSAHETAGTAGQPGSLDGAAGLAMHDHGTDGGFGANALGPAGGVLTADDGAGGGGGGLGIVAVYRETGLEVLRAIGQ